MWWGDATRYDGPMRWLTVLFVAGCGFHVAGGGPGGPTGDGGDGQDTAQDSSPGDDSPIDSPAVSACTIQATGTPAALAPIGGTGGSHVADLGCAATGLPIGLAFEVTPNPVSGHANQILMVSVKLRCGTIVRATSGGMQTTSAEQVVNTALMGSTPSSCDSYRPPVATGEVLCPAGQVIVGVAGNRADTTLYNSVAIVCAALALDGSVTGTTQTLAIAGTGMYTNQPQASSCPAGQAIVSLRAQSGCGQDGLTPSCAPLTCL